MTGDRGIDRRDFIAGSWAAAWSCSSVSARPPSLAQDRRRVYPEDLNAYLRIAADGRVTVFTGKIEMGQGVMTSQAQMVAEELRVALGAVEMVMGDTERCPWDMGTFGSLTTRMFGPYLRAAAAEARAVMLRLASEKLGVPRAKLAVADGVVSVAGDPSRKVTYGELAHGRRILRTVDDKAVLRKASELTVMGTSPQRFDAHAKVTGDAQYAGDIRLPGMLAACVLRPPAHGAKLTKLDTDRGGQAARGDGRERERTGRRSPRRPRGGRESARAHRGVVGHAGAGVRHRDGVRPPGEGGRTGRGDQREG